jgi:hypothetical protein
MGFYTQRFQNKRFLITCHHRSRRFCQKPTSEKTRMHSTPARRLHPRRHGKPSTLATQSSSSRSSRKLRGTTPLIAPSPARRRRVSGARRTVFHDASSSLARVVFVVTKRRHRACDESSRRRTTRATARSTDDERSREVSLPPRRSISSILAFSGARVSRRVSHLFSRDSARTNEIARRFSAGFRARERADPAPGPEPPRHRVVAAFSRARAPPGRTGISPSPSLQPSKSPRSPRRVELHSQKRAEISAGDTRRCWGEQTGETGRVCLCLFFQCLFFGREGPPRRLG